MTNIKVSSSAASLKQENPTELPAPEPAQENITVKATRMATLLGVEAGARESDTITALAIKAVNDPRALIGFEQAFCFTKTSSGQYKALATTSQDSVNRQAPLIQLMEECVRQIKLEYNSDEPLNTEITQFKTSWQKEQNIYPYSHLYWAPLLPPKSQASKEPMGGILLARQTPWREVDLIVLKRIIDTYAHAWHTLKLQQKIKPAKAYRRKALLTGATIIAMVAMLIPVPYTAIAPAQIIPKDPWVVSAPIEGVIDEVHINPNTLVTKDQPLFSFVDTSLRNNAQIAGNELLLADARLLNIKRSALIDNDGRREIAIANAERNLAETREGYAQELLNNVHIKAPREGIILFSNKNDLNGKPVVTGQKIMEIANPESVSVSIEVPPGDELTMEIGQKVNIYLDIDPLNPLQGTLESASFTPSLTEAGTLAYTGIVALSLEEGKPTPRIGLRGSAKLHAGKTPLGYWLFRKPIVMMRKALGL